MNNMKQNFYLHTHLYQGNFAEKKGNITWKEKKKNHIINDPFTKHKQKSNNKINIWIILLNKILFSIF